MFDQACSYVKIFVEAWLLCSETATDLRNAQPFHFLEARTEGI